MSFASLGLKQPILQGIRQAGYSEPTDIQARAIPLVLSGRNLIALGETGSGKTAAFGLPILNLLQGGPRGLRAIVLVPTRELCVQVAESLRVYAAGTELAVCTAFGGIDLSIQKSAFKRGLDVLVACPGRLIDHLQQGNLSVQNVKLAVLDEADRMLDMGFLPQIRSIFVRCPRERQNLLFSATMPPEIESLCGDFLPDAERVQVGSRSQAAKSITHEFARVSTERKVDYLHDVLADEPGRVLVFVRTKTRAEQLGNALKRAGLPADSIHGDKGAEQRYVALKAFERGRTRFLVATDVAARGIDVNDIELVVNFDMPRALEDYVHRVGRTGRAGNTGRALSLVAATEGGIMETVKRHIGTRAAPAVARHADDRDDRAGDARPAARSEKPAPRSEKPAPRSEKPAPRSENAAPRSVSRAPRREESAPRSDKPARSAAPAARRDERGSRSDERAPRREERDDRAPRAEDHGERPRARQAEARRDDDRAASRPAERSAPASRRSEHSAPRDDDRRPARREAPAPRARDDRHDDRPTDRSADRHPEPRESRRDPVRDPVRDDARPARRAEPAPEPQRDAHRDPEPAPRPAAPRNRRPAASGGSRR